MRILHSSDWHLGMSLGRRRLIDLQACVLADLLNVIDREEVDVLVLAGDIYDQGVPPLEAINLFDDFVASVCLERRIPLIAIAGNHDSPERLTQYSALLNRTGFFISGRVAERQVIRYEDVCFHLFPYFHSAEVRRLFPDEKIEGAEDAMRVLVERSLADYASHLQVCRLSATGANKRGIEATSQPAVQPASYKHVALAHCFTQNAEASGTDRMAFLSAGGSSRISASVFAGFDMTFLGHLHRRQAPLKQVTYSGSPAAYAFSEIGQKKGVQIYDTDSGELTFHPLDARVRLAERTGSYESLCQSAADYMETENEGQLLRLILTDKAATLERLEHLRALYPNLLTLESEVSRAGHRAEIRPHFDEQTLLSKPEEILTAFYQETVGRDLNDFQRKAFKRAWEQVLEEDRE